MSGQAPPELEGLPELPAGTEHIWEKWWPQLNGRRTMGMALDPITWPQMESWSRMMKIDPHPWEIEALIGIDDAYRSIMTEETK